MIEVEFNHQQQERQEMEYPTKWQRGEGLEGPEYFDCVNTGKRPFIIKATHSGLFFVGPYRAVIDALRRSECHTQDVFRIGREEVQVYRTRKAAVHQFENLCRSITEHNELQQRITNNLKKMLRDMDTNKVDSLHILGVA